MLPKWLIEEWETMSIEEINKEAALLAELTVRVHREVAKQMRCRIDGMCGNILLEKYHYDVPVFPFDTMKRIYSMSWLV